MNAEYKVPGGKLVASEVTVEGDILSRVKITGDFFMHPEESIVTLEDALKGTRVDELEDTVDKFFEENQISLFGVSKKDIVKVIRMALEPVTQG